MATRRTPLYKRIAELTGGRAVRHDQYPSAVIAICRKLFQFGHNIEAVSEMTGVPVDSIRRWATQPQDIWTRKVPMQASLKMPESTADRLCLAAELLWLARGKR